MIRWMLVMLIVAFFPLTGNGQGYSFCNKLVGLSDTENGTASQITSAEVSRELKFVRYMIGRDDLEESLYLLSRIDTDDGLLRDSVDYLTGWVLYRQKKLKASADYLLQVSDASSAYYKSRFFGAYNLAHIGNHDRAYSVLSSLDIQDSGMKTAMRSLQLAGVALLSRELDTYESLAADFNGDYHVMAAEERRMNDHFKAIQETPLRSPFVGGLLSAAVPGLGKVYAGKSAEGIVSFLYMAALGLTTYDFYDGAGLKSPLFILSASVTGLFYAGNIVGSATAVRRANNEFRHEMDQRILFDMHIPLRNAFN
ncbi:MAG: hypothetical protein R6U62_01940 [Bacteroidales bacterium]